MAEIILLTILFGIEVCLINIIEYKRFNTFLSPATLLSVPLYVVVLISVIFGKKLGFISIGFNAMLLMMAGVLIFFIFGCLSSAIIKKPVNSSFNGTELQCKRYRYNVETAINTSIVCSVLIILLIGFYFVLNRELLLLLGSSDFGDKVSNGIIGHLQIFANIFCILLIATITKKKWYALIPIAIIFAYNAIVGVKYNLILVFLGGLMLRVYIGKLRISLVYLAITAILAFAMGVCVYLVEFRFNGTKITNDIVVQVIQHLMKYLFSGVLALEESLKHVILTNNLMILFQPIITIINMVTLNSFKIPYHSVNNTWDGWVNIGLNGDMPVNVDTFFGAIYSYVGFGGMIVALLIFAFIFYCMFIKTKNSENIWFKAAYVAAVSPLVLSWFSYYYNLLTFYEMPIILVIIGLISKIKNKTEKV